jgi:preflagellin peptidase FlaK
MLIPYTALLSLRSLSRASNRKEFLSLSVHSVVSGIEYALLIVLFTFLFNAWQVPLILVLVPLLLISFLPKWAGYVGSLVGVYVLYTHSFVLSEFIPLAGVLILVNILRAWYGFAQRHVLTKTKRISELEDGDIVGERIVKVEDKVVRETPVSFQMIIKAGFRRDIGMILRFLNPTGEILADPRRAAGVYPEDIARLQKEVKAGRLSDDIKVKASSPFAPAVLLAYVFLQLVGDNFLAWVGRV